MVAKRELPCTGAVYLRLPTAEDKQRGKKSPDSFRLGTHICCFKDSVPLTPTNEQNCNNSSFTFQWKGSFCSTLSLPAQPRQASEIFGSSWKYKQVFGTCWRSDSYLALSKSSHVPLGHTLFLLPSHSVIIPTLEQLHLAVLLMPDWFNQSPEVSCPEAIGANLTLGQSHRVIWEVGKVQV